MSGTEWVNIQEAFVFAFGNITGWLAALILAGGILVSLLEIIRDLSNFNTTKEDS